MIEEIKLVLDSIGDLSGIALWVVGFFLVFKLVVYLSTTGAIVYLIKLGITKLHDFLTGEKVIKYELNGHCINSGVRLRMENLMERMKVSTGKYMHDSDIDLMERLLKEHEEKNKK